MRELERGEDRESKLKIQKIITDQEEKRQISRGRMGIMLPERSAFDFAVRPRKADQEKA